VQGNQKRPRRFVPGSQDYQVWFGLSLGLLLSLLADQDQGFEPRIVPQHLKIWVAAQGPLQPPVTPIDGFLQVPEGTAYVTDQGCQAGLPV